MVAALCSTRRVAVFRTCCYTISKKHYFGSYFHIRSIQIEALIYNIFYKFLLWVNSNIYRARMVNHVLEKLLLFSFLSDILNSNPFLISEWVPLSALPLSKHVFPLCERTNHQLIRSIRSDSETNVLKGRTPWNYQPYPASNR